VLDYCNTAKLTVSSRQRLSDDDADTTCIDTYVSYDDYEDVSTPDVDAKTKSVVSRRRTVAAKKRVYIPVFVPEKQKKKSQTHHSLILP